MKRTGKNNTTRSLLVFSLAVILVVGASLGAAWAYFTTYARALGSRRISLQDTTTLIEEFDDTYSHKYVSIQNNTTSTQPVYVRVAAFVGNKGVLDVTRGKWFIPNPADLSADGAYGYYYYPDVLMPGDTTEKLDIGITLPELSGVPEDIDIEDDLGVIVVYESTPVLYTGDSTATGYGTPIGNNGPDYVGWTLDVDHVTNKTPDESEGGN